MSKFSTFLSLGLLILTFNPSSGSAAGDANSETKLREALRNTMLQLRTAQNDRAALQATQAESEAKLKSLNAQVEALTKRLSGSEKTAAEQQEQLTKLKTALDAWQAAYQKVVDLANSKESARSTLASENIELKRQIADQQTKNGAMFRIANEILTRYERFGLGEALAAKEPFVGVTRVKLENLVQGYEDKIAEAKIRASSSRESKAASGRSTEGKPATTAKRQDTGITEASKP